MSLHEECGVFGIFSPRTADVRSEERRVGKEC